VICGPHFTPIQAVQDWLRDIAGAGGYLCCSASALESDLPPLRDHLQGVGALIEKAAKIAELLAERAEAENYGLRKMVEGAREGSA
jgi:hypothetical protein